jgi:hypothetical protein
MNSITILFFIWVLLSSVILGLSIWSITISKINQDDILKIKEFVKYNGENQPQPPAMS